MLKSIWSVVAGFVTVFILSVATDMILERLGVFPSATDPSNYVTWMLVVALLYRSIYTILGGWATARLAPRNPMKHVVALMILGGISGVAGAIGGWNLSAHWYPVLLAITGPIFVWVGGEIYTK